VGGVYPPFCERLQTFWFAAEPDLRQIFFPVGSSFFDRLFPLAHSLAATCCRGSSSLRLGHQWPPPTSALLSPSPVIKPIRALLLLFLLVLSYQAVGRLRLLARRAVAVVPTPVLVRFQSHRRSPTPCLHQNIALTELSTHSSFTRAARRFCVPATMCALFFVVPVISSSSSRLTGALPLVAEPCCYCSLLPPRSTLLCLPPCSILRSAPVPAPRRSLPCCSLLVTVSRRAVTSLVRWTPPEHAVAEEGKRRKITCYP
jgi:hypothetical protein